MKHLPKLLGALLLTLALLASIGFVSTNAHTAPASAQQAPTTPTLAPNEASIIFFHGRATVLLRWGDTNFFPAVTNICTGGDTIVLFDSEQTGLHLIQPGTCESFENENGFVRVYFGFPQG